MKVELHLLQNFPPANLNRDDMNEPKDCMFGGYRRARISSQCIKRSIRNSPVFRDALEGRVGKRTKRSVKVIADHLVNDFGRSHDDAVDVASALASQLIGKVSEDKKETDVLFYVGADELQDIASSLNDNWDKIAAANAVVRESAKQIEEAAGEGDKKVPKKLDDALKSAEEGRNKLIEPLVKEFKKLHHGRVGSVDVALFGRMLANEPTINIDAACQVAHAISTNEVKMEFDYYTAVDDLKAENDEVGAGMIGFTGYNSSCFYRYAVIDIDKLSENLGGNSDLAKEGIRAFLEAASTAIPTGKQNSFAAQTPTVLAFGVVRDKGMPISLANAFEGPVKPNRGNSLVGASVSRLGEHWNDLLTMYPRSSGEGFVAVLKGSGDIGDLAGDVQKVASLDEVIDGVMGTLDKTWGVPS